VSKTQREKGGTWTGVLTKKKEGTCARNIKMSCRLDEALLGRARNETAQSGEEFGPGPKGIASPPGIKFCPGKRSDGSKKKGNGGKGRPYFRESKEEEADHFPKKKSALKREKYYPLLKFRGGRVRGAVTKKEKARGGRGGGG